MGLTKDTSCVLMIMTNGFEEIEAVTLLSTLRQAGLCVKSVALTSGLVGGLHGIWLMPDLALADLDRLMETGQISLVILPASQQSLTSLAVDPRVHRLLRQVVAQEGQIAATPDGLALLQTADIYPYSLTEIDARQDEPILRRDPAMSPQLFAQMLIRRLMPLPR